MIVFMPHVGSGSTPLKGLSFHASYKMTWLALIVYTNHYVPCTVSDNPKAVIETD